MHVVSTVVLLTAVVMAQADEMSDVLKLPPHKHHMYIFDVTTEASVDSLKASLINFTIIECYKVISERRHLIVFNSNDTAALRSLRFPVGSKVTQLAVEHMNEYLDMFKAGKGMEEQYIPFKNPDGVMFYFDMKKRFPQTVCSKSYEIEMRAFADAFRELYNKTRPRIYALLASYPPRFVEFVEMEENAFQNMIKKESEVTGGYGAMEASTKRILRCKW